MLLDVMRPFNTKRYRVRFKCNSIRYEQCRSFKEEMPTSANIWLHKVMLEQILNDVAFSDSDWSVTFTLFQQQSERMKVA